MKKTAPDGAKKQTDRHGHGDSMTWPSGAYSVKNALDGANTQTVRGTWQLHDFIGPVGPIR